MNTERTVDIVFLLDVTGCRVHFLEALKLQIVDFENAIVDNLKSDLNTLEVNLNARYKVCGFRDQECDGDKWFIEFPFVRNIEEVKTHMNHADMSPCGGGDEPESLLDALYKVGMMPISGAQEPENPNAWRPEVKHCILIISDATFKNATLPEIAGFGVVEIFYKIADKKLVLFGLVPEWSGYDDLSTWPESYFTYYIKGPAVSNLGESGPEGNAAGMAAVKALADIAMDKQKFKFFINILAKDISKSIT